MIGKSEGFQTAFQFRTRQHGKLITPDDVRVRPHGVHHEASCLLPVHRIDLVADGEDFLMEAQHRAEFPRIERKTLELGAGAVIST